MYTLFLNPPILCPLLTMRKTVSLYSSQPHSQASPIFCSLVCIQYTTQKQIFRLICFCVLYWTQTEEQKTGEAWEWGYIVLLLVQLPYHLEGSLRLFSVPSPAGSQTVLLSVPGSSWASNAAASLLTHTPRKEYIVLTHRSSIIPYCSVLLPGECHLLWAPVSPLLQYCPWLPGQHCNPHGWWVAMGG